MKNPFRVNQIRRGLKGSKLISSPLYSFIHEKNIDWAVLLSCAFLPLPSLASKSFGFLTSKILVASLIWFLCYKYISKSGKLIAERKLFSGLITQINQSTTFKNEEEARVAAEYLVREGKSFKKVQAFTAEFKEVIAQVRELSSAITNSGLPLEEYVAQNVETISKASFFQKYKDVLLDASKVGGLDNYYALILRLNEIRRVNSLYVDTFGSLKFAVVLTFVFFAILTIELSIK